MESLETKDFLHDALWFSSLAKDHRRLAAVIRMAKLVVADHEARIKRALAEGFGGHALDLQGDPPEIVRLAKEALGEEKP